MKTAQIVEKLKKLKPRKTLNREMFRAVAKRLRRLRRESHYNQAHWAEATECGTAACIGSHCLIEAGVPRRALPNAISSNDIRIVATNLFGLSVREANNLFCAYGSRWPFGYFARFNRAKSGTERPSAVAADLLDAIASGEVSL